MVDLLDLVDGRKEKHKICTSEKPGLQSKSSSAGKTRNPPLDTFILGVSSMRITKPWLAAIILGTVPSSQSQALEWEITTIDQGGKPSLDLTSDGNPQISYMTEALTGFVRHAIWNGSS